MCQSLADGGRRCAESTTTRHLRNLRKQQRRAVKAGRDTAKQDRAIAHLEEARQRYGNFVSPLEMAVPAPVEKVIDTLHDNGLNALIVGGSVRDVISNDIPRDFDLEVYGVEIEDLAKTLRRHGYRVDEVGKAFGVLKARPRNAAAADEDIDIAVPRKDSLAGVGHRGVNAEANATMGVVEAAERRDYTMNAMMYDHRLKVLVDPYHGAQDYRSGVMRHVSDAFGDDPLRPLRGFQFAARYGVDMDESTVALSRSLLPRASELPVERIRYEWMKFYGKGQMPSKGLRALNAMGWNTILPGGDVTTAPEVAVEMDRVVTVSQEQLLSTEERTVLMASVAARHIEDERTARGFLNHTLMSTDLTRQALGVSRAGQSVPSSPSDTDLRRAANRLYSAGTNIKMHTMSLRAQGKVAEADEAEAKARALGVFEGPQANILMGRHIMARVDRQPGPWMGKLVKSAMTAQENGEFFTLDEAYEWLDKQDF